MIILFLSHIGLYIRKLIAIYLSNRDYMPFYKIWFSLWIIIIIFPIKSLSNEWSFIIYDISWEKIDFLLYFYFKKIFLFPQIFLFKHKCNVALRLYKNILKLFLFCIYVFVANRVITIQSVKIFFLNTI